MPLAISAIGTFLLTENLITPFDWKTLHDSIGSKICTESTDRSELATISCNLQPSYRDLPSHLRRCFLYFSMFPEDYSISRERLIRLWVAEQFVESAGNKTKEQVAEDYLNDLVERNLIVAKAGTDGGRVRSCRVLNLVREINISRQKSFITVLEAEYSDDYEFSGQRIRRLSAHNDPLNLKIESLKGMSTRVHTLLMFGQASSRAILEMVLKASKYLRVLDLEGVPNLEEFPHEVVGLILLKYLSLRKTQVTSVPKSIKNLVLLETLDLKRTKVIKLPAEIKKLKKLRHLLVNSYNEASARYEGVEISPSAGKLSCSIQKLSLIKVNKKETIEALGKLTGLKKLGLVDLETEHGKVLCSALQIMKNLSTLDVSAKDQRSLDLDHCPSPPLFLRHLYLRGSLQGLPKWISDLTSLQKVGLHGSNLTADPLEILQALPNLNELNLVEYYGGEKLVFGAGADKFKRLMTLVIEKLDQLKSLEVEAGALPMLRKLNISRCLNMTSLRIGIDGLKSLYRLFLQHMPNEVIAMLEKHSPHRHMVQHIPVIHSYKDDTGLQDLS